MSDFSKRSEPSLLADFVAFPPPLPSDYEEEDSVTGTAYFDDFTYEAVYEETAQSRNEVGADFYGTLKELVSRWDRTASNALRQRDGLIAYAAIYGGMTDVEIAEIVSVSRSSVNRIRNASETRSYADEMFTFVQKGRVSEETQSVIENVRSSDMDETKKAALIGALTRADLRQ